MFASKFCPRFARTAQYCSEARFPQRDQSTNMSKQSKTTSHSESAHQQPQAYQPRPTPQKTKTASNSDRNHRQESSQSKGSSQSQQKDGARPKPASYYDRYSWEMPF